MKVKDLPEVVLPGELPEVKEERGIVRGLSTYSLLHLVREQKNGTGMERSGECQNRNVLWREY